MRGKTTRWWWYETERGGYAIMYSIWGRFRDILQRGSSLIDTNAVLLSPLQVPARYLNFETTDSFLGGSERSYREEYINLLSIEPKMSDLLTDRPLAQLTLQMDKGRNEFRNSQVHSISNQISSWGIGVPDNKQLRGFGNDTCGRLLCPSTQD